MPYTKTNSRARTWPSKSDVLVIAVADKKSPYHVTHHCGKNLQKLVKPLSPTWENFSKPCPCMRSRSGMWALQNPSKQLPRPLEIGRAQKKTSSPAGIGNIAQPQLRRIFQIFVFFYSEAEPGQPTHSAAHDLQELLMLALDAPCQGKCGQLHPALIEELPKAHPGEQRYPTAPALSPGLCMEEQDSFPTPTLKRQHPPCGFLKR